MTLASFIREDMEGILDEWITFARTIPSAKALDRRALRDDAKEILLRIVADMEVLQNHDECAAKSRGEQDTNADGPDSAAQSHAGGRLAEGFSLPEMVSEYRALRASVVRRWIKQRSPGPEALNELTLLHEGFDQALAESSKRFTDRIDRSRELFMGVLGHDLRTPLQVILQCTRYLNRPETPTRTHAQMAGYIEESAEQIRSLVEDLLDVVKTKLGGSLPVSIEPVDFVSVCHRAVNQVRLTYPSVSYPTNLPNALFGMGDAGRLHQLVTNLLKNAAQHGDVKQPITVGAHADAENVFISVHNEGKPIPADLIRKLFEPLTRGEHIPEHERGASLGLGLYIAHTIANAHGGRIDVASSPEAGTTFTVCLPLAAA